MHASVRTKDLHEVGHNVFALYKIIHFNCTTSVATTHHCMTNRNAHGYIMQQSSLRCELCDVFAKFGVNTSAAMTQELRNVNTWKQKRLRWENDEAWTSESWSESLYHTQCARSRIHHFVSFGTRQYRYMTLFTLSVTITYQIVGIGHQLEEGRVVVAWGKKKGEGEEEMSLQLLVLLIKCGMIFVSVPLLRGWNISIDDLPTCTYRAWKLQPHRPETSKDACAAPHAALHQTNRHWGSVGGHRGQRGCRAWHSFEGDDQTEGALPERDIRSQNLLHQFLSSLPVYTFIYLGYFTVSSCSLPVVSGVEWNYCW